MTTSLSAPRIAPELRAAIYHFAVFGSTGVASVYFAIWLSNRGITPDEIGIINAVPVIGLLLINLLVGRLADRAKDWRQMIIVLSLLAATIPIGLLFVSGFWGILLIWSLSVIPAFSVVPLVDAATMRLTQRRGSDFGFVRAWGTVGYMVATGAAGPLIAWLGDAAFAPLFITLAVLRGLLSLQLPQFRAPDHVRKAVAPGKLRAVLKPWFMLTLLGMGVLYSTHSAFGAFSALLWRDQGIPGEIIGPLVATMAAAEALMMFLWKRLKLKIPARNLIILACLIAAFRWTVMAFSPPVWMLFLLQTLHAFTYAMGYLGGMYFIANWTSEDIAAEAQGFSYFVQNGISVLALVAMGWVVTAFGAWAWLVLGGYTLLGAALVLLSIRLRPPTAHPVPVAAVEDMPRSGDATP